MLLKPLLLPSNGFGGYNEIIDIYPLDVNFILNSRNHFINLSFTEFIYWILKNYTNIKDPSKILIFDASYIYFVLYGFFISNEYEITNVCSHCNEKNNIPLDLSTLEINYVKSKKDMEINHDHSDISFKLRYRKIKDSLKNGNIDIFIDESKIIERIYTYIFFQCEEIIFNNEVVQSSNELCDIIKYHSKENLTFHLNFFDKIKNLDAKYGFIAKKFECIKCKKINNIIMFDSFTSSIIDNQERIESDDTITYDYIKNFLAISSQKMLTFSEIKKIPMNQVNEYFEAASEIIKLKAGSDAKDYFSSGGLDG